MNADEAITAAVRSLVEHDAPAAHVGRVLALLQQAAAADAGPAVSRQTIRQWAFGSALASVLAASLLAFLVVGPPRSHQSESIPRQVLRAGDILLATRDARTANSAVGVASTQVSPLPTRARRPMRARLALLRAAASDQERRLAAYLAALRQLPPEVLAPASAAPGQLEVTPLTVPDLVVESLTPDQSEQTLEPSADIAR